MSAFVRQKAEKQGINCSSDNAEVYNVAGCSAYCFIVYQNYSVTFLKSGLQVTFLGEKQLSYPLLNPGRIKQIVQIFSLLFDKCHL